MDINDNNGYNKHTHIAETDDCDIKINQNV